MGDVCVCMYAINAIYSISSLNRNWNWYLASKDYCDHLVPSGARSGCLLLSFIAKGSEEKISKI